MVSPIADFQIGDYTFELGEKKKERSKFKAVIKLL